MLREKRKRREHSMQLDPGDVNHCFMRSPFRCKLEHRLPSLVKGSGKQSSFSNQWRVRPSYGEYCGKEWWVSNENFKLKIRRHAYVNCTERSGIVRCYEIHPQLKAARSSWKICRHASHLFDLQEQISSLNVKKKHRSVPLLGTLR